MAIRQRGTQSLDDTHIRAALTAGLVAAERSRDAKIEFEGGKQTNDAELMRLDQRIAWYKRKIADEGNYSLVLK